MSDNSNGDMTGCLIFFIVMIFLFGKSCFPDEYICKKDNYTLTTFDKDKCMDGQ